MHDGGVLVGHLELVDEGRGVLVEEDAEVWRYVVHQDVDVAVPVRQLMLVDQADGVTDLVQVQTFLPNKQHSRFRAGKDLLAKASKTADFVQVKTFLPNKQHGRFRAGTDLSAKQHGRFRAGTDLSAKQHARFRAGTDLSAKQTKIELIKKWHHNSPAEML